MTIFKIPVKLAYTQGGSPGVNVWHARIVNEETDLENALDALAAFYNAVKVNMRNSTQITIGSGMIRDPYGNPTYVDDDVTVLTGGGSSASLSPLLAYCINWKTASASRSGRGRTFIGPLTIDNNEVDGTPAAAPLNAVRTAATNLVATSQGIGGWSFGVYSQKQGILRDFTGSSVADKFAYLSSRRD